MYVSHGQSPNNYLPPCLPASLIIKHQHHQASSGVCQVQICIIKVKSKPNKSHSEPHAPLPRIHLHRYPPTRPRPPGDSVSANSYKSSPHSPPSSYTSDNYRPASRTRRTHRHVRTDKIARLDPPCSKSGTAPSPHRPPPSN